MPSNGPGQAVWGRFALYRLTESARLRVKQHGAFRSADFEGPLVI